MCPHTSYAHSAAAKSANNAVLYCRLWQSNRQDRQRFRRVLWQDQARFCRSQGPTTDAIDLRGGDKCRPQYGSKKIKGDTQPVRLRPSDIVTGSVNFRVHAFLARDGANHVVQLRVQYTDSRCRLKNRAVSQYIRPLRYCIPYTSNGNQRQCYLRQTEEARQSRSTPCREGGGDWAGPRRVALVSIARSMSYYLGIKYTQVGYIIITVIAQVARDLWQCKQTFVLGLCPRTRFVYCHKSLAPVQ